MGLGQRVALRRDIAVVEAVEIDVDFFEEFKKHTHTLLGVRHGVRSIVPRHEGRSAAEGIGKRIAHDMPVSCGKAQVFAHGFTLDVFVGVVVFKGERIFRFGAFEGDFWDFREVWHAWFLVGLEMRL